MEKKYMKYYIVAIIDLLGQQKKLEELDKQPLNMIDEHRFSELFQKTIGEVQKLRKSFELYIESAFKDRPIPEMPQEQLEMFIEYKKISQQFKPKIKSFSDTLVIYSPISDGKQIFLDSVYIILHSCCSIFTLLLSRNILCRGGIELGIATEIDENEIYGPAINNAYKLETKIAQYPRIVIGKRLIDLLNILENNSNDARMDMINKNYANLCKKLIFIDGDGHYALDYLGQEVYNRSKEKIGNLIADIYKGIITNIESLKQTHETNFYMKYLCLLYYFYSRKDLWKDYIL